MKNITTWSKTILSVYKQLSRVTNALDKIFNVKMMSGAYNNKHYMDTFSISNQLIDLSQRKINLINLKLITEKALVNINRDLAKILVAKFIDYKKCNESAETFGCTERTVFRKINLGLISFGKTLIRLGFDEIKLQGMLLGEKWIIEVFRRYNQKEEVDLILEEKYFCGLCADIKRQTIFSIT